MLGKSFYWTVLFGDQNWKYAFFKKIMFLKKSRDQGENLVRDNSKSSFCPIVYMFSKLSIPN